MVDRSTIRLLRRLSPQHLLLLIPWIGLVIAASSPIRDNSFLWHVRAGTVQLDLGRVLTSDPFSFTMQGAPWRTQSWLAELGYGILDRWTGGLTWVPTMQIAVGALTLLLVGAVLYGRTKSLMATGVAMALFSWLSLAFQVQRPVLLSFLLLSAVMLAVERRLWWALPLIIWTWAGIHGSWVVGVGYLILAVFSGHLRVKRAVSTIGASLVLASLTAHGLGVWQILLSFLRNRDALRLMSEWVVPDLASVPVLPYTFVLMALLVAAAMGKIRVRDMWIVVPFALFGLLAARNLLPAAIVLLPWAALVWPSSWPKEPSGAALEAYVNLAIALAMLVLPLALFLIRPHGLDERRFPVAAVEHLEAGRTWHDDASGGFLIYSSWPDRMVYIDDRAELYGADAVETFVGTRRGQPGWARVFDMYGITQALVKEGSGLDEVLADSGFSAAWHDDAWTVWTRDGRRS